MSAAPDELYQEVLLDHNKSPRNYKKLPTFNHTAEGHNPLCGDNINLYVLVENGKIQDIGFQAGGCAISRASASIMGEAVKGKSVEEAAKLFTEFRKLLTTPSNQEVNTEPLGDMGALVGVRLYPVRVKCATLCWHALQAALESPGKSVTTE